MTPSRLPGANAVRRLGLLLALAARAASDGYTLLLGNVGTVAINPSVFGAALKVDPLRDFIPVTIVAEVPGLLVVNPAFPAKNVRELVDYVRAHPGEVSFASSGSGAVSRLDMERLRALEKLEMTHVPDRAGAGQAGTPEPVVRKLYARFAAALADPEVRQRFDEVSTRAVASSSPADFAGFVAAETARWGALVKRAGATAD